MTVSTLACRGLVAGGECYFNRNNLGYLLCFFVSDCGPKDPVRYLILQILFYFPALTLHGGCKLVYRALFEPHTRIHQY